MQYEMIRLYAYILNYKWKIHQALMYNEGVEIMIVLPAWDKPPRILRIKYKGKK
jgi:hypothetical protein